VDLLAQLALAKFLQFFLVVLLAQVVAEMMFAVPTELQNASNPVVVYLIVLSLEQFVKWTLLLVLVPVMFNNAVIIPVYMNLLLDVDLVQLNLIWDQLYVQINYVLKIHAVIIIVLPVTSDVLES
jgi:hypothetical protein